MRIVAWNIRWGGNDRPAIARAVAAPNPDVAILTEYRPAGRRGDLVAEFKQLGWCHHLLVHETAMVDFDLGRKPKMNGILAVSRVPIEPGDIGGPIERPQIGLICASRGKTLRSLGCGSSWERSSGVAVRAVGMAHKHARECCTSPSARRW